MPGLDPRRADLVVAGAVLLDTILRRLGAEDLTLCDLALREGLVLDYIRRNRRQIAQVDKIPDVRRRSALELAERCNYHAEHAQQVVRLALALFDQTRAVHGLTDREREWLEYAALLHDVGGLISYARHHRHSYYLIKNGDLRGFHPDEIEVIALVARYHRRGTPKRSHEEYAGLSSALRRTVRTLASILRVAESLDRSHGQVDQRTRASRPRRGRAAPGAHGQRRRARGLGHEPPPPALRETPREASPSGIRYGYAAARRGSGAPAKAA